MNNPKLKLISSKTIITDSQSQLFENLFSNLSELLTTEMVAEALHTTKGTVYQWHSRPRKYGVPEGMFLKHGRRLLIRREVLRSWVLSRCS